MENTNKELIVSGKVAKVAKLKAEGYEFVDDIESYVETVLRNHVDAHVFTFIQQFPDTVPKFPFKMEWDNLAAIPVTSYDHWWKKQINDKTRNMVRKSVKKGVEVRLADFNDELVKGIANIYNETPVRQGKPFWHYGKSMEIIAKDNATFLERSDFIGAYYQDELIGFVKLVHNRMHSRMMQILARIDQRDKAPINALVAKSVELCEKNKTPYLVYSKYSYGNKGNDSLSDFKLHNGFVKFDIPRYYVPLDTAGKVFLSLNLHRDITEMIPSNLYRFFLDIRSKVYGNKRK